MAEPRRAMGAVAVAAACSLAVGAGIVVGSGDGAGAARLGTPAELLAAHGGSGTPLVFRRVARDPAAPAAVAVTAARQPATEAATLSLRCSRIHYAAGAGLCLVRGREQTYRALVLGRDLRVRHSLDGIGTPSRARVSPDGRLGALTVFVSGHSYDGGSFTVKTTLLDLRRGRKIVDLEHVVVTRRGLRLTAVDMNVWGVTFARNSDRFYATLATGGQTYLVRGSVRERLAQVLTENVECPSLSPDGTRLAYKRRVALGERPWRLTVLDLATMRRTALAETRSVDDQVEWLDDAHVLYGVDGGIWMVPADGSGAPRRVLAGADSPAVVR